MNGENPGTDQINALLALADPPSGYTWGPDGELVEELPFCDEPEQDAREQGD